MLLIMNRDIGKLLRFVENKYNQPGLPTKLQNLQIQLEQKMKSFGFENLSQFFKVLAIRLV